MIGGSIPPGLSFSGLTAPGTVNTSTLTLTGTPTAAGSYSATLRAWESPSAKGNASPVYTYVINVAVGGGSSATAPSFTTQPASQTVSAGATVTFTAAASGSPAPAYQWSLNSTAIAGATSATLTLSNVQTTASGSYAVTAANSAGTATSNTATLVVNAATSAPVFTTQPVSQTVNAGTTVAFTAAANGSPTPTYQWNLNGTAIAGATSATLTLSAVQTSASGSYSVTATNSVGNVTSNTVSLVVNAVIGLPTFTTQPVQQTMPLGSTVVFSASATAAASLQWTFNGAAIAAATNAMLVLTNLGPANAGSYACVATNTAGSTTSSAAVLTVGAFATPDIGHLVNVSILTSAGSGPKMLTVGTVIGPPGLTNSLPLVIRAVGPTLNTAFGLSGVLPDPVLTVNTSGNPAPLATNAGWGGGTAMAAQFAAVGAFALPTPSKDSAYLALPGLNPGGYTVQVTSASNSTGTVLAEIYDAGDATRTATTPRLINLSTLTSIDAGSSLTAGFVLRGLTSRTLLVRGIGPSLTALGVGGVMPDPQLDFFNNDTGVKITGNDNWGGASQLVATMASVGAFPLSGPTTNDAVLLITVPPGAYSARVSDVNGAPGTAIVEVYEVP